MAAKSAAAAAAAAAAAVDPNPASGNSFDYKRDAYGFAVRPQHLQRYREYSEIYEEEEKERSDRWRDFLQRHWKPAQSPVHELSDDSASSAESIKPTSDNNSKDGGRKSGHQSEENKKVSSTADTDFDKLQIWREIRPSLHSVEDLMSSRVKKKPYLIKNERESGASKDDSDEEFYDLDRSETDSDQDIIPIDGVYALDMGTATHSIDEQSLPFFKELECLVQGGVPMALRGELWQAFVGAKARRIENYYQKLLKEETELETKNPELEEKNQKSKLESEVVCENWKTQIDKDLPRTFPGHPALNDSGRNALRRILTAYARHNPSVAYCQAMNFFAGLLLLLMPEENAFWTLTGILDDSFGGYYTEEMLEAQVDQLALEDLVRESFPKLAKHLDFLGVQVAWMTGPWFLSIFINVLPWESVLRVWDLLLFEGHRVMLFRTTLGLMDLYGPALVTTRDAGDAVKLFQSLADSTFDSSHLVLTACMAFQNIQETQLHELRNKHRPLIRSALDKNMKAEKIWKDSQTLAYKLYIFRKDPSLNVLGNDNSDSRIDGDVLHMDSSLNMNFLHMSLNETEEIDSDKDIEGQLAWLKAEFCKQLKEKRSSELRAEELNTSLMEMVKQDNRRQLSARVEQLEREIVELRRALADKQEQEDALLEVLLRVEQEQKVTEDARQFAEQDAAAQRYAVQVIQEKYEEEEAALAEMERRAIMAESVLEATLHSQSEKYNLPRPAQSPPTIPNKMLGSLFRWRDRNKQETATITEHSNRKKPLNDTPKSSDKNEEEANSHQIEEEA